ncbi:MAG: hypothetical protein HY560_09490 [Gemmatimonadetes bacterium]|nr:hypothetical protein [Gemmatimonadota bacterium]
MQCFELVLAQRNGRQVLLCARMYRISSRLTSAEVKMLRARQSRSIFANQSST